jgi:hypothetical protein
MTPTELIKPVHVTLDVPGRGEMDLALVWSGAAAVRAEEIGFDVAAFAASRKLIGNVFAALWAMASPQINEGQDEPLSYQQFLEQIGGFQIDDLAEAIREAMVNSRRTKERPTRARKKASQSS